MTFEINNYNQNVSLKLLDIKKWSGTLQSKNLDCDYHRHHYLLL